MINFKDCYCIIENSKIIVGNSLIKREYEIRNEKLIPLKIEDVKRKIVWGKEDANKSIANFVPLKDYKIDFITTDNNGLSAEFLRIILKAKKNGLAQEFVWEVFPDMPFVSFYFKLKSDERIQMLEQVKSTKKTTSGIELIENQNETDFDFKNIVDCIPIIKKHYKISTVKLYDKTDINDSLVSENTEQYYFKSNYELTGNIFLIDDYLNENGLIIVKEAPTHSSSLCHNYDLSIDKSNDICVVGTGISDFKGTVLSYGSTVGVGESKSLYEEYKKLYAKVYKTSAPVAISNTWGDRNQDAAVCEEFMLKEIEIAAYIGIDSVMIDDGWQKGITANSKLSSGGVWEGYYADSEDFWQVNNKKFPNGLTPLIAKANEHGITLSLWFSPDSSNDFANWEKDVDVLVKLFNKYGIKHFKLDGVKIRNKTSEYRYLMFVEKVYKILNRKVCLVQDITAEDRLGYLYKKQYGILFVENRYTDFTNYFPHKTLKNIWQLSKFFPTVKMHMEFLNNKRNHDKYGDDPLAPCNYDIDYLFASVMVSNPLVWMEMQNLSTKQCEALKNIIAVFKKYRDDFAGAVIYPIGILPDGTSFTGFQVKASEKSGYLILFREFTKETNFVFEVTDIQKETKMHILATNDKKAAICAMQNDKVLVEFSENFSYAFVKYSIN